MLKTLTRGYKTVKIWDPSLLTHQITHYWSYWEENRTCIWLAGIPFLLLKQLAELNSFVIYYFHFCLLLFIIYLTWKLVLSNPEQSHWIKRYFNINSVTSKWILQIALWAIKKKRKQNEISLMSSSKCLISSSFEVVVGCSGTPPVHFLAVTTSPDLCFFPLIISSHSVYNSSWEKDKN